MKKQTLNKLGTGLLFCALLTGTFFACEKNELEMIDAIELEDNATAQEDKESAIEIEDLHAGPKPPNIRIP